MSDQAPLIFERKLGMLSPVNPAAREALSAIEGRCTVKITRANRNQGRRAVYWIVTGIVADLLNDAHDLTLTDSDLHDIIRRKLGYFNNNRDRHRHGNYAVGSAHHMSKIDEALARKIAADPRATKIIAQDYGVSLNTVHRVKSGTSWRHLDMARVPPPGKTRERTPRGQAHPQSKLTEADVLAIRADSRPQSVIGAQYGIKQSHVSSIKLRLTWKHLP